jgi:ATP-dependent helicase/nuclease subunit B
LLRNNSAVHDFLAAGGTLVVPSRQRAAAVRLAYASAQISAGLTCWDTPDVLPWSAWLARLTAPLPAESPSRVLSSAEVWWLWRQIIAEACPVPDIDRLADQARHASDLLDTWGLTAPVWPTGPLEEWSLLGSARRQLQARTQRFAVSMGSQWRGLEVRAARPTWCTGFDELGAADRLALTRMGVRLDPLESEPATAVVRAFADREQELLHMAAWCRRRLEQDPSARLLLVIPDLERDRAAVVRSLAWMLEGDAIRSGAHGSQLFEVEPGSPVEASPAIAVALQWWRLACEPVEFTALSILLRSSFLDLGDVAACLALENWLRDRQVLHAEVGTLTALGARIEAEAGAAAAAVALRLRAATVADTADERLAAGDWATRFADSLRAAGWPGPDPLDIPCEQARQTLEELLAEFATLNDVGGTITGDEALTTLLSLAARTRLEARYEDVPVTVTDSLVDPVVHYDGIWVCGLTAERWPPPAAPNPFIPHELLRQAGLDLHTPAGQLRLAEVRMRQWRQRTGELIFSYARLHDDLPLQPSPLLPEAMAEAVPALSLADLWRGPALALQPYGRQPALSWPLGRTARGGAHVLVSQAACPFQALGRWRLACEPLCAPEPGVPATVHGQIVHAALQALWRELQDSGQLARREPEWPVLVQRCVSAALEVGTHAPALPLPAALLQVERRQCERLLLQLLEAERHRAPFAIATLETGAILMQRGLGLRLRLDRVDRLASGGSLLIDYKTGRPEAFDADAARPRYTQLLAYALVLDDRLTGLANVHLRSSGATLRGLTSVAGELPGVRAASQSGRDWPQVVERWRGIAAQLIEEFVAGEARVDPEPGACRHCHLQTLCRIDAASPVLDAPVLDSPVLDSPVLDGTRAGS